MSYCRFGKDSDVYVYYSIYGQYECCGCNLRESQEFSVFDTAKEMVSHLNIHKINGEKVPQYAIDRLIEDNGKKDNMTQFMKDKHKP